MTLESFTVQELLGELMAREVEMIILLPQEDQFGYLRLNMIHNTTDEIVQIVLERPPKNEYN